MPQDIESIKEETFAGCIFQALIHASDIASKELNEKNIAVLRNYPELMKYLETMLEERIEKFETMLRETREFREQLTALRSGKQGGLT